MKKINSLEYNTLLWFLTRATFIEITAEILLNSAHQDSWISIIIAIIIGLLPFSLFSYLKNKYPNQNIIQINKTKLGKFGTFLNLILIASTLIFTICSFWITVHFIDSQYLYRTPIIIIIIVLLLPVIYTIIKNIHVFSKVSLIMFYISLFFIVIILTGLVSNIDIDNLKPILNNKDNILYGSFCFIGFNILPLFLLNIIPKNKINNYSPKKSFIFYLISSLSLLNVMFLTISIFGIHLSELYNYPSFHLLKRVSVLDIIDRVESILSLEWFLALFVQIIISLFFIKEALKETFQTKEKTNNIIMTIVCLFIAFLTNLIFTTQGTELAYFKNILIYILYIAYLIIPLILFFKSLKKS